MSERLTAEREKFVRERVAGIDPRDLDEADRIIVELLAEFDAVRAERDTAEAAFAEVHDAARVVEPIVMPFTNRGRAAKLRLQASLAAFPADLAAGRDRRVRAEVYDLLHEALLAAWVGHAVHPDGALLRMLRNRAAEERGGA